MAKSNSQIKGEQIEEQAIAAFKDIRTGLKPYDGVSGLTKDQYALIFKMVGSNKAEEKAERAVNMGGVFWSQLKGRVMFCRTSVGSKERTFNQLTNVEFKKRLHITINGSGK